MAQNRMIAAGCARHLRFSRSAACSPSAAAAAAAAPRTIRTQPGPATPGPLSVLPPIADRLLGYPGDADDQRRRRALLRRSPATRRSCRSRKRRAATRSSCCRRNGHRRHRRSTITVQDCDRPDARRRRSRSRPAPLFGTLTITPSCAGVRRQPLLRDRRAPRRSRSPAPGGVGIAGPAGALRRRRRRLRDPEQQSGDAAGADADRRHRRQRRRDGRHPGQSSARRRSRRPIRATDVTTGNQVNGQFTIVQHRRQPILSVMPDRRDDHRRPTTPAARRRSASTIYIYGGTPPYTRRTSTFPNAVTLLNGIAVSISAAHSRRSRTASCVNPLTFTIIDATGPDDDARTLRQPARARPRRRRRRRRRSIIDARSYRPSSGCCTWQDVPVRRHRRHAAVQRRGRRPVGTTPIVTARRADVAGQFRSSVTADSATAAERTRSSSSTRARRSSRRPRTITCNRESRNALAASRKRRPRAPLFFAASADVSASTRAQVCLARRPRAHRRASPSASSSTKRIAPAVDLLVARHQLEPALERQAPAARPAGRARSIRRVRRCGIVARPARSRARDSRAASTMPAATASPCSHVAVAGGRLDRVAERVAEVEQRALAGLALVGARRRRLDAAAFGDRMRERVGVAREQARRRSPRARRRTPRRGSRRT